MKAACAAVVLLAACGDDGGGVPDAGPDAVGGWGAPACTSVSGGDGAVTFTLDDGATLAPTDPMLTPTRYTTGVVALASPGRLVASGGGSVYGSSDAGCTWEVLASGLGGDFVLVTGGGDVAYGFVDNGDAVVRVDDDAVVVSPLEMSVIGMVVDPANEQHVRIADSGGQLHDSTDGGALFTRVGVPALDGGLFYRAAFDPADLDRAAFGLANEGVRWTADGGTGWTTSTGLAAGGANVFRVAWSPAASSVVWAQGLDLSEPDGQNRHIWRSTDGAATFDRVVDASASVILINGNPLFPHPTDPGVLYFSFGSSFAGEGTYLYRYEAGEVTSAHNDYHEILAVAFAPGYPRLLYVGLSLEDFI